MRRALLLTTLAMSAGPAAGQFLTPATTFVQAGGMALPVLGGQAGVALPGFAVFTREAMLYAHYRFGEPQEQHLRLGLGVGGSIRVLRILFIIFDYAPGPFELDAGLRFGPSFAFSFTEQTAATRARQFRLFGDLFVRGTVELAGGRLLYAEVGTYGGLLRGGVVFAL